MSDDGQHGSEQPEPTADECVRAGMYWFGRSDFQAAQAWWERAVELDPRNTRAQECLRLLNKTSSIGFKQEDDVDPFEATSAPADTRSGFTPVPAGSGFSPVPRSEPASAPAGGSMDLPGGAQPPVILGPGSQPAHTPVAPPAPSPSSGSTDAFDFAATGQHGPSHRSVSDPPAAGAKQSPWDDGPSRTSVVTLHDSGGFDAVPEPTPLPEIDRERFFNRGDPQSHDEIVSFLKATGDLPATEEPEQPLAPPPTTPVAPAAPPPEPMSMPVGAPPASGAMSGEIVFTDPVEMSGEPEVARPDPEQLLKDARDRFGLHDFDGVLERIEQLPADLQQSEEVRNLAAEARRNLLKMYESKIGDFEQIPRVIISDEEVIWLNLNHRAGFILSQIDGTVTFEDLVALSGMPRLDTVRILADLIDKRVVG